jgi:hypothetical protein
MNLSEANFSKTEATCLCKGKLEPITYYTYESNDVLYDVLKVCGITLYNFNSKESWKLPIHTMIEKHFHLGG